MAFIFISPFYDIIHIHTSEPASLIRKSIYFFIARFFHKKIIIHFHSYSPKTTIFGKYKGFYKYIFSHADRVIVLSDYWKNIINESFGNDLKIMTIYNPCDTSILRYQYEKRNCILYAGTITPRKGYKDLIIAFASIASQYPNWKIIFAGNGEISIAKELVKKYDIIEQVKFLGWVENEIKDRVFKEAKIFCLPSYAEGFPMAILDAWAYGLPVIATPVGGLQDVAVDNENVLLFNPGDIVSLSSKISQLISNEELQRKLSNEGLFLSNTKFAKNRINQQIGELYHDLMDGR